MTNIILTGFMGSGKTVVGNAIAKMSGALCDTTPLGFLDTDDEIIKRAKMTIPHIFEHYGEYYFRELEEQVARDVSVLRGFVIATGGGIVSNARSMEYLTSAGMCFYLKTTPDQIYKNTEKDANRPLLNVENRREKITSLMELREPLYLKYCDIAVETAGRSVSEIAAEILNRL